MGLRIKELNETSSLSTDDYIIVDDGKETKKARATNVLVSTAALNAKQDLLISGTSIKTINSASLLGSGDIAITKSSIELGNVDNTSDLDKPISTATQTALNAKQDLLVSGTNIKSINGNSILGSGNIVTSGITYEVVE